MRQVDVVILVCGGRDYGSVTYDENNEPVFDDKATYTLAWMARLWGEVIKQGNRLVLVHGACPTGVDAVVNWWGETCYDVTVRKFPADWKTYGKAAGPRRNQQMIDETNPKLVVAFPGGRGTTDMITRARQAGIPVLEIPDV